MGSNYCLARIPGRPDIAVHQFPAKKISNIKKVARVGNSSAIFFLHESGRIYCTELPRYFMVDYTGYSDFIFKGLHKLGVISKDELKAFQDKQAEHRLGLKMKDAKFELLKAARRLGIKIKLGKRDQRLLDSIDLSFSAERRLEEIEGFPR